MQKILKYVLSKSFCANTFGQIPSISEPFNAKKDSRKGCPEMYELYI